MDFRIVNLGEPILDTLRAVGLATILATATEDTVELHDQGPSWHLQCVRPTRACPVAEVLSEILALPSDATQKESGRASDQPDVMFANLDGLLAATCTWPGVRVFSLHDLSVRAKVWPAQIAGSFAKVHRLTARLIRQIHKARSAHTIEDLTAQYQTGAATLPQFAMKATGFLSVPMPFSSSFAYSIRRPCSDGLVASQTNLTLRNELDLILAFVGAARFLRAQRVAGDFVNLYVPLPRRISVSADTAVPLLRSHSVTSRQALLAHWLSFGNSTPTLQAEWRGVAFQTLQTQSQQQSISVDRGILSYDWFHELQERAGAALVKKWFRALVQESRMLLWEIELLIDVLWYRSGTAWMQHVRELSLAEHINDRRYQSMYTLREIQGVADMLQTSTESESLRAVLNREEGTLRIGRSLRLLGRINRAAIREIKERLDSVHDDTALIRILADAAQECELASARTQFMLVPNENDLGCLLDDIAQYGASKIANLLMILASVRYSTVDEQQQQINEYEEE